MSHSFPFSLLPLLFGLSHDEDTPSDEEYGAIIASISAQALHDKNRPFPQETMKNKIEQKHLQAIQLCSDLETLKRTSLPKLTETLLILGDKHFVSCENQPLRSVWSNRLKQTTNINEQDENGNTTLHILAGCGDSKLNMLIVVLAQKPYIDPDIVNNAGQSALDIAVEIQAAQSIRVLQQYNASSTTMKANGEPTTAWENFKTEHINVHSKKPAVPLEKYFHTLKKGATEQTEEALKIGVKKFMELANLPTEERKKHYGHRLNGLHFGSDLANAWNDEHRGGRNKLDDIALLFCAPSGWIYENKGHRFFLLYNGKKPLSEGLNDLMKGPTVIDCGMFCQLSIWMALRYYLSDKVFNELFDSTPFYITQFLYENITASQEPFAGNPLFSFFDFHRQVGQPYKNSLEIAHIANTPEYSIKHPGGNSKGENCIIIDGAHTIFGPQSQKKVFLGREAVETFLRDAYNAEQSQNNWQMLKRYQEQPSEAIHPAFNCTFSTLIHLAEQYKTHQVNEEDWKNNQDKRALQEAKLVFNYTRFKKWTHQTLQTRLNKSTNYVPHKAQSSTLRNELLSFFPVQNEYLSFENFKTKTSLQKGLYTIGLQFCHSMVNNKPHFVTLRGEAGTGKTAILTACYKELLYQNKSVLWLSQATDKELLTDELDAVFIDENNSLPNSERKILFKEAYKWYVTYHKGLFVTARHDLFTQSYGHNPLTQEFECPPFLPYDTAAYQNMAVRVDLGTPYSQKEAEPGILDQYNPHFSI